MKPIESEIKCKATFTNDKDNKLVICMLTYGAYTKKCRAAGGFPNNYFVKIDNRDDVQYMWTVEDKNGTALKSYKKVHKPIEEYLKTSCPVLMDYKVFSEDNLFDTDQIKDNFCKKIKSNKDTYKSLGFDVEDLKTENVEIEILSKKYKVTFESVKNRRPVSLELNLIDSEDYEEEALRAVMLSCGFPYKKRLEDNIKFIEYCYDLRYTGTYSV